MARSVLLTAGPLFDMIRTIIFDFGNVLVEWDPLHLYIPYFGDEAKARWFVSNICTLEWHSFQDGGRTMAEGTAELIAKYPEWEKEIRLYYEHFDIMIPGQVPGMEEYVRELKAAGYHVCGLSNWSAESFPVLSPKYPVLGLIEDKVISGYEKLLKPDPAIYRLALGRFGANPDETVFVDDNPANVAAARALGIHAVRFESCAKLREDLGEMLNFEAD